MLKGKVALVTGGSRGIGAAIALRLAKAGADVAILYAGNSQAAQATCADIEAQGVRALAVQCDVKDFEAVKAAVDQVVAQLGGVDILVNNAGITRDKLSMRMSEEEFDQVIGLDRLRAVHLNDSKDALGSHKDRHAPIGEGEIGFAALAALANHPKLRDVPFYLEAPDATLKEYGEAIEKFQKARASA